MKCNVKGCNREMHIKKHGLCKSHYNRLYTTGEIGEATIRKWEAFNPYEAPERHDTKRVVRRKPQRGRHS